MARLFRPVRTRTDPTTGRAFAERDRIWHGRYTDAEGNRRTVPLAEELAAARLLLGELVKAADAARVDLPIIVETSHSASPKT
jgi:hypothetical protein